MGMSSQPSAARASYSSATSRLLPGEVAQLCSPRGEAGIGRVTSEVGCVDAGWVAGVGGVDLGVDGAVGVDGGAGFSTWSLKSLSHCRQSAAVLGSSSRLGSDV